MTADDIIEFAQILWVNAKKDPINNAVLPMIGAGIVFALWYYDIVSWKAIHMFFCYGLEC